MCNNNRLRSALLIGKSQLVLDNAVAGLRDLGRGRTTSPKTSTGSVRAMARKFSGGPGAAGRAALLHLARE